MDTNRIGTKASTTMDGDCNPTRATIRPSVAARLYAGAVDATPMTTLERSPIAPVFSPLPPSSVERPCVPAVVVTMGTSFCGRGAVQCVYRSFQATRQGFRCFILASSVETVG